MVTARIPSGHPSDDRSPPLNASTQRPSRSALRPLARVTGLLAALALRAFAAADQPPSTAPDILILNSYAPGYEWSDDELAGVVSALRGFHSGIEPVVQYLDFKRFPGPERETALLQDVAAKCRQRPPQLIVTLDNAAFDFALAHRAHLGPEAPLVFGGLNRFTPEMIAGQPAITGVSEETDFSGTFHLIASLRPEARHIVVLGNATESSREKRRALEVFLPRYADRYAFEFFEDWTNEQLFARVARLGDDEVGLVLDLTRDSTGRDNYRDGAFTETLVARSRAPLFLTSRPPGTNDWSRYQWDGLGGGMVVARAHGEAVGRLAVRILRGERAAEIPVVRHSPQVMEVDYRQMRRFGISTELLPHGTRLVNDPATFYRIHRSRLVAAALLVVFLCVIIVALSLAMIQRRRAERALRRTEEQLRAAQKMEAIGQLAGGVAHDFNNILQVIRGHAGFLRDALREMPRERADLEAILLGTQRAAQLTRQLLLFSRRQVLSTAPCNPDELVEELAKMLRRVLGEHIELMTVPLDRPLTMLADKGQLEQVLLNLCLNARDALSAGGRITISLTRSDLTAADCAQLQELRPGPHLVLKVSDNGCGMPRAVLDHLFEPFFTTKDPGRGTGLGLSVVYGIVRQHRGAITVSSEVGVGSVFRILLPIVVTKEQRAAAHPEQESPQGGGTVLLAEDDPAVRSVATRVLEGNGFHVLAAADGEQAEELIREHHASIRLAVVDLLMPKRNGREVRDLLCARHPGVRVLFCSACSPEMLPPGAAPGPGATVLHKPYSSRELLATIHRLLHAEGRTATPLPKMKNAPQ
ncbi:MAG TPA: ATP-binding protein [Opitutaceae bacterium]|nr:ATP-binding protein [Opitutaceae bacterium]